MNSGQALNNSGPQGTISVAYLASLLSCGQSLGIGRQQMLSYLQLSESQISPSTRRLPQYYLFKLFDFLERETGREDIGLEFAKQAKPGTFIVLGYAAMSCESLKEAIRLIPIYEPIVLGFSQTKIEEKGNVCRILWQFQSGKLPGRAIIDAILGAWYHLSGWITDGKLGLLKVYYEVAEPADVEAYNQFFGCPIEFDAGFNALEFDEELLSLPLQHTNSQIHIISKQQAQALLQQLATQGNLNYRVSECLHKLLARQECGQQAVSRELGLSERSLRRQLEKEGHTFREILLETRQGLAELYLSDQNLSLIDVALLLGFTEHSSFTRAFKGWHGITPNQWRKKHL